MFSNVSSLNKVEALQKRALRFLYSDYDSTYDELLFKSGKVKMSVSRNRILCIEIYKTLHNINPNFMSDIFKLRSHEKATRTQYKMNLEIPKVRQVTYGEKSLAFYRSKIWNSLPYHIKSAENLETFRTLIKNWDGVSCNCLVCEQS